MKDVTCQKYFLKQFVNQTSSIEGNFYDAYKRRSPDVRGEQVNRPALMGSLMHTQRVYNSWVVPYNPKLARMFAFHSM